MNLDILDIDGYRVATIGIGKQLLGSTARYPISWNNHVEGNDWISATPVNCCTS